MVKTTPPSDQIAKGDLGAVIEELQDAAAKALVRQQVEDLLSFTESFESLRQILGAAAQVEHLDDSEACTRSLAEALGRVDAKPLRAHLGTDVLEKLLTDFQPVLLISMCHPKIVLAEVAPTPKIGMDNSDKLYERVVQALRKYKTVHAIPDSR